MNGYAKTPEAAMRAWRQHLPAEMALYELLAGRRLAQPTAPTRRAQRQGEPLSATPERRAERHAEKVAQRRKKAKRKQSRR